MNNARHTLVLPPYGGSSEAWLAWIDGLPASLASGMRCLSVAPGHVVAELTSTDWPLSSEGSVPHGYVDALIDNAFGVVAFTRMEHPQAPATVTLHAEHLSAARLPLRFELYADEPRGIMVHVSCLVSAGDGTPAIRATGTMIVDGTSRHVG